MDEVNTEQQAPDTSGMEALYKIANASNIEDVTKWAENANSRLGNSITLPSEPDADTNRLIQEKLASRGYDIMVKPDMTNPDQMKLMRAMMGTPDEAGGYTLPEQSDDLKYDPVMAEAYTLSAHKNGLSQSQMEGVLVDIAAQNMSAYADRQQQQYNQMTELKKELGFAYDEKVAEAGNMMKVINPEYDPTNATAGEINGMIRLMDYIGGMAKEGQNFQRPAEVTHMTPDEAKTKIADVVNKLDEMNMNDPQYGVLMKQKRALYREAYPDTASSGMNGTAGIGGITFNT